MVTLKKEKILGVGITAGSKEKVLEYIETSLKNKTEKYYIVTPNPELLAIAHTDARFKAILNEANIALPDGVGVLVAGKLLGKPFPERITGVDFVDLVCKRVADLPITTGFLGGGPGVAERTSECLQKKYPGLKIFLAKEEWDESDFNKKMDILFVAFGSPKQEKWISENIKALPVKVVVGVGGAFDMISGKTVRAPRLIRNFGLEWLFRLLIQPWRIKRQTRLLKFTYLVAKEYISTIA